MKKILFDKDFLGGGASAAEQIEGHGNSGKSKTIGDDLYLKEKKLFYKEIGPQITSDFFYKYKNDIKMWADMNINSVRLSFSGARVFPDGKNVSLKGVNFYHNVLNELKKYNIKTIMTLMHFDMPLGAQKLGGGESKKVIDLFAHYSRFIFKEFGNKVYMFATFNEPAVPIGAGYMGGSHPPRVYDLKRASQAGYGTILAHAKAVNIFNLEFKHLTSKIGVVINISPSYPKDGINYSKADKKASDLFNLIHNYAMLDPMIKGSISQELINFLKAEDILPKFSLDELKEIKKVKVDYVGMNYYSPSRFQEPDKNALGKDKWFKPYKGEKARMNVFRGGEIYPEAIYDASLMLKNRYNNLPFYISENGMGVQDEIKYIDPTTGEINDDYRIAFIQEHLVQIHRANKDGANCFGYHLWAIEDCWSWINAYKNTYGFIAIDLKTQKRKYKKSAHGFSEVIINKGFDNNFLKVEDTINLKQIDFIESDSGYSKYKKKEGSYEI